MKRWSTLAHATLATSIVAITVLLYTALSSIHDETRRIRVEFRENLLWFTKQTEHELFRLITDLDAYYLGLDSVSHADLIDRMDIFWSRIESVGRGSIGASFLQFEGAEAFGAEARQILSQIETPLHELRPGDRKRFLQIRQPLQALQTPVTTLSALVLGQRHILTSNSYHRLDRIFWTVVICFAGVLLSGGILVGLLLFERRKVEAFHATLEDRVAERTAELEREILDRRQAEHDLRETQALIQGVIDAAPFVITVKDLDHRLILINRFCADLHRVNPRDVLGTNLWGTFNKEFADEVHHLERQVISSGEGIPFIEQRGEIHGRSFDFLTTKTLLKDHTGTVKSIATIAIDISDQKTVQRDLEVSQEQLRQSQKMEAVGQLTGGIAHDFNNLLAVISGNLELLRERLELPLRDSALLDNSLRSAVRGQQLTQRLLAFSRRQALDPKLLDINQLVRNMTGLLGRSFGEKFTLLSRLAGSVWPTRLDAGQLETALLNLSINARDAMPSGGTLTIETANWTLTADDPERDEELPPGDYVALTVTDQGTGMDEETRARAFEPFYTTKPPGEGTGLGLSMIYGFVRQSGGGISLESDPELGTAIRLFLPRANPDGRQTSPDEPKDHSVTGSGELILVVEDDTDDRSLATIMLTNLGFTTLSAKDGPSGLALLTERPDVEVLLTDLNLPFSMDGKELAQRALDQRPNLSVLFMSGVSRKETPKAYRPAEGAPYLIKPITKMALADAVTQAIGSRSPDTEQRP